MKKPILVLFTLLLFAISSLAQSKQAAVNDLPEMTITLLDGKQVVARELPGNVIIIVFFPDCDHCQREAKAIQQRITAFKKYTVYFVATTASHFIQKFADDYGLSKIANVKFGKIETQMVYQNFGAISTPSLYIYSKERKLVKQFNGETSVDEIIKFL